MQAPPIRRSPLRWTLPLDGAGSFLLPPTMLASVPLLAWAQTPAWLIGAVLIAACVILAGCGVAMAVAMARTMRSGHAEHPELARFLRDTARQSALPEREVP